MLGTTASLLTRAKQLLSRFLRSRRSHSGQCRSGLAQALQVVLCSHMESIRPLPLGSAEEALRVTTAAAGSVEQMSRARWGLVVFDNDGVVVDSEALAERAMSETLTSLGYPMTREEAGNGCSGSTLAPTRRLGEEKSGQPS